MTSLPTTLTFGTPSSATSVRDAIASYRRAQLFPLALQSTIYSSSDLDEDSAVFTDDDDEGSDVEDIERGAYHAGDDLDFDDIPSASQARGAASSSYLSATRPAGRPAVVRKATEDTPLLRKAISFSAAERPRKLLDRGRTETPPQDVPSPGLPTEGVTASPSPKPLVRRTSTLSSRNRETEKGRSTFGQSLFNSIAILLGIGMLSEPLAFACAGWIGGSVLIVLFGYVTCYTAKLLAHIMLEDRRLRSYADIGRKAFGPRATPLTSIIFFMELFALSVVLITLYADSLHAVVPTYSANAYKLWGLIIIIPTVFLPLSLLSFGSVLGILSSLMIIAVIFIDGFSKKHTPGSLLDPAPTQLGTGSVQDLGMAFGLFMAGFSGHVVLPSLAKDMTEPGDFDVMINWAFTVATAIYAAIGVAGYLMFGRAVSDEVSKNLLDTPGYNPLLNQVALWTLVVSPLSKYALATRPLNITIEYWLGIEVYPPAVTLDDEAMKSNQELTRSPYRFHRIFKQGVTVLERCALPALSVLVAILVPEFSVLMSFLGAFSAFILCIIYPITAKIYLNGGQAEAFDIFLLIISVVMACWGTTAAFWTAGTD